MSQVGSAGTLPARGLRAEGGGPFPIVGVGASAGGLAATSELLRHLGPDPRVALVIVHHLDRSHDSSLVDLLSRVTPLPVQIARDGGLVEANNVYVVPPNAGLEITAGRLKLTPRLEPGGLHLPVDHFFESLAADRTVDGIGVVLTGTGADGSMGIKTIKAGGGITFAQDASAEYGGMPQNAIATGCVDHVLPAGAIARELVRLGGRASLLGGNEEDAAELPRILSALTRSSGIDFANYKQSTLQRRVQRRVVINRLPSWREYADLLERSPDEARALCDEVLIHVTSFFRDGEMFESLKTAVFPRLLAGRPRDACIRIWVPGCSTGEEVYSIAIALREYLADADAAEVPIKLFGTDVSPAAIDRARAGRYPASIKDNVAEGRLARFFVASDGAYQVRRDLRDLCVFAKQDATRDPPFAGMDLISCRNLMIYLGSPLQDRVLPIFHYALKELGFLVLGTSETIRSFPGFAALDLKNRIYTRTAAVPRLLFAFNDPPLTQLAPHDVLPAKPSGGLDVQREADRLVLAEYAPPGVVITDDLAIVQFRGRTGGFLEPTPGVASFDLLRMVREDLRLVLRQTIDDARGRQTRARRTAVAIGPRTGGVEIEVIPLRVGSSPQRFYVVLFREVNGPGGADAAVAAASAAVGENTDEHPLAQELAATRQYLESVIEQLEVSNQELRAANEEIVSSNEELRSTNEELQMAKEELQASNEELGTVNDEMTVRNLETTRLNDDLTNLLTSVEIPIVILGRDSCIRRFTPAAGKLFRLADGDIGRPIGETRPIIAAPELQGMINVVLQRLLPVDSSVQDDDGRWHQVTVRPYLTLDNRIDGTVVMAFDIDAAKKGTQLLGAARQYAESIVDTMRECLVVLDCQLRVRSANRAFRRMFALGDKDIVGQSLQQVGGGDWNVPALKRQLETLGTTDKIEGYRLEWASPSGARRAFLLNARHIEHTMSILLALEDVTEKERAELAVRRAELGFREMLSAAAEAIVMTDAAGRIVFANASSAGMFGYAPNELLGLSVETLVPERLRVAHVQHRARFAEAPSPRPMGIDRELRGRRKDGSEFPVEITLSPMPSEDGPLVVGFIADVTRRREADRRRAYQEKLQQMTSMVAVAEERERRRIAVDLHDHIGQALALAQIKLTGLRGQVTGAVGGALDHAIELLARSIDDTRTLIFDLSPPFSTTWASMRPCPGWPRRWRSDTA